MPYRHTDAALVPSSPVVAVLPKCDPESASGVLKNVFGLRSRHGIAGFHARRREDFVCSYFFLRFVGFGSTNSCAIGAFTMPPPMLCQDQAIPSISSHSAKPLRRSYTNTHFFFHSRKYLWTEPRRKYLRLLSRLGFGISGSACSQNSSEIVHGFKALMGRKYGIKHGKGNVLFADKLLFLRKYLM